MLALTDVKLIEPEALSDPSILSHLPPIVSLHDIKMFAFASKVRPRFEVFMTKYVTEIRECHY